MKRHDIQGLRCLCILMVLLYHYYPDYFPQGKLGVDIFFVISGFLIALMLSKEKESLSSYCFEFYWRRLKRIFPMCYLVFLFSYLIMYLFQMEAFTSLNRMFGQRTLFFMANIRISEADAYEAQLSGSNILLTHYWSLSTEVQFYLFAPLLVRMVKWKSSKTRTLFFSLLFSLSLIHYLTTTQSISFNSPLARLWQFLVGFLSFYNCQDLSENIILKKDSRFSYICLLIIVAITFVSTNNWFVESVLRFIVTIASGWMLMAVGRNPKFLEHHWFVYIGDISFVLYLVHWPILCFVKAYAEWNQFVHSTCILISFLLALTAAIVLHEKVEKRFFQWGDRDNFLVILLLASACAICVFGNFDKQTVEFESGVDNEFFTRAIKENQEKNIKKLDLHLKTKIGNKHKIEEFSKHEKRDRLFSFPGGTGNLTILVIGNSYAGNHQDIIYNGMKHLHNRFFVYWTSTCETLLTSSKKDTQFCVNAPMKNAELVSIIQPDILFIVERGFSIKLNLTSEFIMEDFYVEQMIKNVQFYEAFTKRIFILGAMRTFVRLPINKALEYLKKKQRLRDSPSLAVEDHRNQRMRLEKIDQMCRKCVVYEWEYYFYNSTGHFVPYDDTTDVLYFEQHMHLGDQGLKKMGYYYNDLGREMHWMLENKRLLIE